MAKTNKHRNIMKYDERGEQFISIICRGCAMKNRELIWNNYVGSISSEYDRKIDNSYLTFEEEPENKFDANAVKVVCCGEAFGTVGYVGREYTEMVKQVLAMCKTYRIELADEYEDGCKDVYLLVYWN